MSDVICEWENDAMLGEGPVWVARENAVYWLDIIHQRVHRLNLSTKAKSSWQFDEQITSLAPRQSGGFVGTVRDGFAFINVESGEITPILLPESHLPGNRFNDGKLDSNGCFYAGSMDESEKAASGKLYRLNPDLSLHTLDDDYIITNGPAFSPDGTTLYHNDTIKRCIYAYDVNSDNSLTNKRILVQFDEESQGSPDGLTVDAEGCLWQASFAGFRLTRFSPAGEVMEVVKMPVKNITSCTFAGDKLDTLYITTARLFLTQDDIARYPLSGSLFSYQPGVSGLPTPVFPG